MAQQEVHVPLFGQVPGIRQLLSGARIITRPLLDIAPGEDSDAVVVSLRPPQYGIPLATRVAWMREVLPNGTPRYIGLFTSMPSRAGVGGTEASGSGYARVMHQSWRDVIVGGFAARRANSGAIRFAALTDDLDVIGWGAWDASSGGTLRAFGLLRNSDSVARVFHLAAGDTPGWNDGELQVVVQ